MGWKTFKQKYKISHLVHVDEGEIHIGSYYCSRIASVNLISGEVKNVSSFSDFLEKNYPEILKSSKEEILKVINEKDSFSQNLPVFTYRNDEILELQCEGYGFPNNTHSGLLMYDNTFFPTRKEAINKAIDNLRGRIAGLRLIIADGENTVKKSKQHLKSSRERLLSLIMEKGNFK